MEGGQISCDCLLFRLVSLTAGPHISRVWDMGLSSLSHFHKEPNTAAFDQLRLLIVRNTIYWFSLLWRLQQNSRTNSEHIHYLYLNSAFQTQKQYYSSSEASGEIRSRTCKIHATSSSWEEISSTISNSSLPTIESEARFNATPFYATPTTPNQRLHMWSKNVVSHVQAWLKSLDGSPILIISDHCASINQSLSTDQPRTKRSKFGRMICLAIWIHCPQTSGCATCTIGCKPWDGNANAV